MVNHPDDFKLSPFRERLYETIFEADTRAGRVFDVILMTIIVASIIVIMLDSVEEIDREYGELLIALEWVFTGLFTAEYLARLYCVRRKLRYVFSFFGIVDLMAVLPTYASLFVPHAEQMQVIRALRLVRVFRVFKLVRFIGEANTLWSAIKASLPKLTVFLVTVMTLIMIIGTSMHVIEGPSNPGLDNIPKAVYWAIVTVTTVGYGDTIPITVLGKMLASVLMVCGFAIIAVPTGIVAAEFYHHRTPTTQVCPECLAEGHDEDSVYCKYCGAKI